jgi:predicted ArsR family transcriptional regulator
MSDDLAEQASGVGALAEPARRELYLFVAAQSGLVSREQAAAGVGLPLHSVKFHLDRLVDEGLLETEFRRLTGRTGPGAGRPSKLYRRSGREFSVSLPQRRYDLAGTVLAAALEQSISAGTAPTEAVREAALDRGRRIARDTVAVDAGADTSGDRAAGTRAAGSAGDLGRVATVLDGCGFEPRIEGEEMCLANCPFDRLAGEHTDLVCGMNLALVDGVLDGLGVASVTTELVPHSELCCVRLHGAAR